MILGTDVEGTLGQWNCGAHVQSQIVTCQEMGGASMAWNPKELKVITLLEMQRIKSFRPFL
jgi:hypothetical protein